MDLIIRIVVFFISLVVGLFFGRRAEKRHFQELARREAELKDIMVFSEKNIPPGGVFNGGVLVTGSVVIAEDYFKRVAASLRSFFGGRMSVYESLLDRGRREAIVRMKEEAKKRGAIMIFNVRLETSSLASTRRASGAVFSAEFIAYGTALTR